LLSCGRHCQIIQKGFGRSSCACFISGKQHFPFYIVGSKPCRSSKFIVIGTLRHNVFTPQQTVPRSALEYRAYNLDVYGIDLPMRKPWTSRPSVIDTVLSLFDLLGEDRYLTTLLLKRFPLFKTQFVRDAHAFIVALGGWGILLPRHRCWINSTVHNLGKLVFLEQLYGFCCLSMYFMAIIQPI